MDIQRALYLIEHKNEAATQDEIYFVKELYPFIRYHLANHLSYPYPTPEQFEEMVKHEIERRLKNVQPNN